MMGNPNAKVKVLEIASLGCPYCKRFEDEGAPHLLELVKSGQISWEFRPYVIHGPIDVAADIIARCNGIKTFFPLVFAMYKDQETWMGKVEAAPKDQQEQMQNLPTNQVFAAFATAAGLQDWAAARGLPPAKSNQCLSDQKMIDHEVQVTSNVNTQYPEFTGTPASMRPWADHLAAGVHRDAVVRHRRQDAPQHRYLGEAAAAAAGGNPGGPMIQPASE